MPRNKDCVSPNLCPFLIYWQVMHARFPEYLCWTSRRLALWLVCLAAAGCVRQGFDVPSAAPLPDGVHAADQGSGAGEISISDITFTPDPDVRETVPGGRWTPTSASPLIPKLWISAAWSGKEFMTWAGAVEDYHGTDTGARLDPISNQWTSMTTNNTPGARHSSSHLWSGKELLVFGGAVEYSATGGGGRYDPFLDRWRLMSTDGAPSKRLYHAALWTGTQMFIWGGWGSTHLKDGTLYDPVIDQWADISAVDAPSSRCFQSSVWTGARALIWGGCTGEMGRCPDLRGDGASYNPKTDTWTPISAAGAPSPRATHFAVWTGKEMIIFGGCTEHASGGAVNDGFAYDPALDQWRTISSVNAPSPRCDGAAGWIGKRMVIWGGADDVKALADGASYDPETDTWTPLSTADGPIPTHRFAWAASPESLFIWGGVSASGRVNSGAVWTPFK